MGAYKSDHILQLKHARLISYILSLIFSSNDAPFGEYGVSNVALTAVTSGQLISRNLSFDINRSGGNLGTTQVTVNITYDQVRDSLHVQNIATLYLTKLIVHVYAEYEFASAQ